MMAKLHRLGQNAAWELGKALYHEGERIMGDSKANYVPVDKGILRASGHVLLPQMESKGGPIVVMGYGGPAVPYALRQHEELTWNHPGQGQPKYLETPAMRAAASAGRRIADDLRKALKKYASA